MCKTTHLPINAFLRVKNAPQRPQSLFKSCQTEVAGPASLLEWQRERNNSAPTPEPVTRDPVKLSDRRGTRMIFDLPIEMVFSHINFVSFTRLPFKIRQQGQGLLESSIAQSTASSVSLLSENSKKAVSFVGSVNQEEVVEKGQGRVYRLKEGSTRSITEQADPAGSQDKVDKQSTYCPPMIIIPTPSNHLNRQSRDCRKPFSPFYQHASEIQSCFGSLLYLNQSYPLPL